jgi:uncharacterized membrane protein YgdD (TMEM256/DUF423 family)
MRLAWLSPIAALACASSVALGAYASHAAMPGQARQLALAAAFGFAHGLALIVLKDRHSTLAGVARLALFLGLFGFSGGLCLAAFGGGRAVTAPAGGSLLMIGWLLMAVDLWLNREAER